ncbi:hypothetical protein [Corynebacterium marinum]|uniref:Uncharacterized protein n=1 Tax=Corynebacterium marinum DSM 44953 TaxID=1224162 RepID=A0A0B6TR39_9CORY|nr:hypothetical protein [Corynebacterium marinum]AJK68050.1 hypothetical protein B840_02110 [Corynebacterium marinum DSM 44953]GGO11060.1 hypothetical protein GCM10010980_01960 [Corynebacterium marinum]
MSELFLDHAGALHSLNRLVADGEEQLARHTSTSPALPAAAAIAAMLQRLHATGTERIDAVRATARAAAAQVRVLRDVDEHLADELGGAR